MENDNVNLMEVLLQAGLDPNQRIDDPYDEDAYALQRACTYGKFNMVRILVDAGADVNLISSTSPSDLEQPLQIAIDCGNNELVAYLLSKGADPNTRSDYGDYPLHSAVKRADIPLIDMLLDAGADINFTVAYCGDPLMVALSIEMELHYGQELMIPLIKRLLDAGPKLSSFVEDHVSPSPQGETVVERAARTGNLELVQLLLESGAQISKNAICFAARSNKIHMVELLLDAGATLDSRLCNGDSPLQIAIQNRNHQLVTLFLKAGIELNDANDEDPPVKTPLQAAAHVADIELIRFLLDAGANVNAPASLLPDEERKGLKLSALEAGAATGNADVVGVLLRAGAYVDMGMPLSAAVHGGSAKVVQLLLDADAEPNAVQDGRPTALQVAVQRGDSVIIDLLLTAGAAIDALASGEGYQTVLTAAIETQDTKLIRKLLDLGADVNNPSARSQGRTALEAAVTTRDIDLVRYLLCAGASANDPGALFAAVENDASLELVQLLLTARSRVNGQCGRY